MLVWTAPAFAQQAETPPAEEVPSTALQIDRLTPIPGVLDYDRDRIIDVKAQQPAG